MDAFHHIPRSSIRPLSRSRIRLLAAMPRVVLVKCPGCDVTHLIADHKGWFGKPGSVEDFMAEKGEAVLRRAAVGAQAGAGAGGTIEITEEELMGWSPAKTGEGGGVAAEDAAQQQQLEAADAKGSERRG